MNRIRTGSQNGEQIALGPSARPLDVPGKNPLLQIKPVSFISPEMDAQLENYSDSCEGFPFFFFLADGRREQVLLRTFPP